MTIDTTPEIAFLCDGDDTAKFQGCIDVQANYLTVQLLIDRYTWMHRPNKTCAICGTYLTWENISRHVDFGHDKLLDQRSLRLDSMGRAWCNDCSAKHDNIDWDEVHNR